MGYQNSTFPLAIYGGIDTASRKILWLKAWTSNNRPELPALWYFEYLYGSKCLPNFVRMDRGTETGKLATMHRYLRRQNSDIQNDEEACGTVLYITPILYLHTISPLQYRIFVTRNIQ